MSYYDAFEISPVPSPSPDAIAPDPFRGIYGMPMFVTVPTADLAGSSRFWQDGLGFFELFCIPGRLIHLRRWAFQDVLLVSADRPMPATAQLSVSFACVLSQIEKIAAACETALPASVTGPTHTFWNTVDLQIVTPENTRVIMTAAKPLEPGSSAAEDLAAIGISVPGTPHVDENPG